MSGPAAAKRLCNGCTSAHIQRYLSSPTQTDRMRSGITVPKELPGLACEVHRYESVDLFIHTISCIVICPFFLTISSSIFPATGVVMARICVK